MQCDHSKKWQKNRFPQNRGKKQPENYQIADKKNQIKNQAFAAKIWQKSQKVPLFLKNLKKVATIPSFSGVFSAHKNSRPFFFFFTCVFVPIRFSRPLFFYFIHSLFFFLTIFIFQAISSCLLIQKKHVIFFSWLDTTIK